MPIRRQAKSVRPYLVGNCWLRAGGNAQNRAAWHGVFVGLHGDLSGLGAAIPRQWPTFSLWLAIEIAVIGGDGLVSALTNRLERPTGVTSC